MPERKATKKEAERQLAFLVDSCYLGSFLKEFRSFSVSAAQLAGSFAQLAATDAARLEMEKGLAKHQHELLREDIEKHKRIARRRHCSAPNPPHPYVTDKNCCSECGLEMEYETLHFAMEHIQSCRKEPSPCATNSAPVE